MPSVPFLVGGLGDFLKYYVDPTNLKNYPYVNEALKSTASHINNVGFVSAEGLTPNGDNLHFNAKSLREFGIRYFDEYKKLTAVGSSGQEKANIGGKTSTEMELL
jgi:hypothetical protein